VFELPGTEVARDHEPSLNLHDFRWDHALAAGRRIFAADFPDDVTVWLIEAASTDFGIGLSPAVAVAANKVIDRISRWLDVVLSANAVTAS
jgi:hydrogenase maturation protease